MRAQCACRLWRSLHAQAIERQPSHGSVRICSQRDASTRWATAATRVALRAVFHDVWPSSLAFQRHHDRKLAARESRQLIAYANASFA